MSNRKASVPELDSYIRDVVNGSKCFPRLSSQESHLRLWLDCGYSGNFCVAFGNEIQEHLYARREVAAMGEDGL